ncbi:hypothetical protein LptCag_0206 [Leptospirillum ferriphilum]|uniref:Uncharacterized protein n=1 Tax=Leptospirillum ferriphilum TaxID=178606 RepID=A0A094W7Y0_9BACT|nr:hypothetical protein LptCag_0206 [Leptospirillum ferriphilum]
MFIILFPRMTIIGSASGILSPEPGPFQSKVGRWKKETARYPPQGEENL